MSLSKKQLKAVGRALAAGSMTAEQRADLDALLILADQAALSAEVTVQAALDASWPDAKFVVRGRAKSKETLAEKLNRMGPHTLPIIRDLAGIRVVGKMSRRQQDQVMSDACRALGYEKPKLIDRRQSPSFGYRALHAELVYQGCKIEVQVRTELRHLWADAYEGSPTPSGVRFDTAANFGTLHQTSGPWWVSCKNCRHILMRSSVS
jgi:hypothetical protein